MNPYIETRFLDQHQRIATRKGVALGHHLAAGDVQVIGASRVQCKPVMLPGSAPSDRKTCVLLNDKRSTLSCRSGYRCESSAKRSAIECLLLVAGHIADAVRHDPYLQEVHGIDERCILFAVSDASAS